MTGLETAGAVASIVTTAVTTATLIVLIWYTVETQKLRREAQRQNENSMMPIVAAQTGYFEPYVKSSCLAIRNLGSGPAFNIQISSIQISGKSGVFEHSRTLAPGQVEILAVAGIREVKIGPSGGYDDGKIRSAAELLESLRSAPSTQETKANITYTNASGKKYRTTFTIDNEAHDSESLVVFGGMEAL